ncbi:NYN domain-containing protein [Chlorobium phaeovibrioides]|uniref:NYN domain-containing protein n=1 Tax=Chlorobium phaeovibrioides TaxID=1094 RepID=A0A432AXI8_CHLPH|nr:NYN domain-containing protein [Chlorobium phaeovibrioides]RTY39567.1 NYN domain-containing protein [Chlorobium phaeovibrioides]
MTPISKKDSLPLSMHLSQWELRFITGNISKRPWHACCGHVRADYNEKMTDVNIATQMLIGAYQDQYDVAVLVSGDSDLVPPIRHIHDQFPAKRVVVAFPPKRHNQSVRLVAKGSMTIGRKTIIDSQFADTVPSKIGYSLRKPEIWA